MYHKVLKQIGVNNILRFFPDGREALDYLSTTSEDPFLVICDISMPKMDGLALRRQIVANPYLRKKGTPFVFRTKAPAESDIKEAYELAVQGFFGKTNDPAVIEKELGLIFDYWMACYDPPVLENKLKDAL
jgi:CheY-like chemotaxis protein